MKAIVHDLTPHRCCDNVEDHPLAARAATTARHRVVKWIMRTFRDGAEGVLVYGSTVGPNYAANAARGMQGYAPAVIEGRWNALTIFDALLDRLPPAAAATERDRWRNRIDAVTLQLALQEWLAGPLNEKPALLVIDGLHDVLESPASIGSRARVKSAWRPALAAALKAFGGTRSQSRLLLTSRCDFSLSENGAGDCAAFLKRTPIAPMLVRRVADILVARGALDEALRLRRELELPVFERCAAAHERAVTIGRIADILQAQGKLDEALRLRKEEEELPVYERLDDEREHAEALGQVAAILRARGEFDAALRIHREERLPAYERLCDLRGRAAALSEIANILQEQGLVEQALHVRRENELPIYEGLGDVRYRAMTIGKIGDLLQAQGFLDEALRIRREVELPTYERLNEARGRAETLDKIGDILEAKGALDEAERLRREEELPAYLRLGDARGRLATLKKIEGCARRAQPPEVFRAGGRLMPPAMSLAASATEQ